jgi:hypothetical protein
VEAVEPDVAVDARGDAIVVWERWDGTVTRAELRRYAADGTLGTVRDLRTGGDDVRPRVAGDASAVWLNSDGGDPVVRVEGRDLTPTADLYLDPQIASDGAGRTIAVWARGDVPGAVIEAARLVPPPPPPAAPPPVQSVATADACPSVTVLSLRSHRRRGAGKGVGAKLTLDRDARLRIVSAKLVDRGRTRKLRTPSTITGDVAKLRFKLPAGLARRIAVGRRVTLKLRLRTAAVGCAFGPAKTLRLRTSVRSG